MTPKPRLGMATAPPPPPQPRRTANSSKIQWTEVPIRYKKLQATAFIRAMCDLVTALLHWGWTQHMHFSTSLGILQRTGLRGVEAIMQHFYLERTMGENRDVCYYLPTPLEDDASTPALILHPVRTYVDAATARPPLLPPRRCTEAERCPGITNAATTTTKIKVAGVRWLLQEGRRLRKATSFLVIYVPSNTSPTGAAAYGPQVLPQHKL